MKWGTAKTRRYVLAAAGLVVLIGDLSYFAISADGAALMTYLWPYIARILIAIGGVIALAAAAAGISIWIKSRSAHHA